MDLAFDLDEALKREDLSLKDIKSLRDPPVPGVPSDLTDKQLALFLNACDKDVEYTRKVMEAHFLARKNAPEFFNERDPNLPKIQQCLGAQDYSILPVTPDGHHVIFHALKDFKSSNYHFENAVKTFFMQIDSCLYSQGPRKGLIVLFDMKGVSLTHLMRVNLGGLKKFFHYLQDCLPCQLHRIHVINVVSFFDVVLKLIKPFMKAELLQMLHLHKSTTEWEEFHTNCIPRESLPSDCGGDCPSLEELNARFKKDLVSHQRGYFLWEEKQRNRNDENNNNSVSSTTSAFKKLEID